jgi:hypothetical protein
MSGSLTGTSATFSDTISITANNSNAYSLNLLGRSADNATTLNFFSNNGVTRYGYIYTEPTTMLFGVSGSTRLTIASTGTATLSIASGIYTALNATSPNTSVYYKLTPTGGDSYILGAGVAQTNDFCIYNSTRSTNYLTILGGTSGGNVGIGTTSPIEKLDVTKNGNQSDVNWGSIMVRNIANYAVGNDASIGFALNNSSNSNCDPRASIGCKTSSNLGGDLVFNTRNDSGYTEKMRITKDGQVTIPSQPAWSVGRSTAQSFSSGTPTTINWDQSSGNDCFIQGGVTLNGGNGRITVPVAGKYVVLVSIRTEDPGAATGTNLNFRKNGATILRYYVGASINSTGNYMYLETRPVVVSCAANDYLDFYFDSVTNNFSISAVTNTVVRFSGYLVG